jgi:hypothetical protein
MRLSKTLFILVFIGGLSCTTILLGSLGINSPPDCNYKDADECQKHAPCGVLCTTPSDCKCFPSVSADWAPVYWMIVIQVVLLAFVVAGCVTDLAQSKQPRPYTFF